MGGGQSWATQIYLDLKFPLWGEERGVNLNPSSSYFHTLPL